jgi:hypothetical protein
VDSEDVTSAKTKILAYLGQLKPDDWADSKKICLDLDLRFTTAKNTLSLLETRDMVEKIVTTTKGTRAKFRLNPTYQVSNGSRLVPYVPPEWSPAYGKHPNSA